MYSIFFVLLVSSNDTISSLILYNFILNVGPAFKKCMENGEWWRHPETNMTWSNYTQCVNIQDLEVSEEREKKQTLHQKDNNA